MKALVIIDVQNDFTNGSLAVKNAKDIFPVINNLLEMSNKFDEIIYNQSEIKNYLSSKDLKTIFSNNKVKHINLIFRRTFK